MAKSTDIPRGGRIKVGVSHILVTARMVKYNRVRQGDILGLRGILILIREMVLFLWPGASDEPWPRRAASSDMLYKFPRLSFLLMYRG